MFNSSQSVYLSIDQALEGIDRATEHFRQSAPVIFGPACYGDNREPLYCGNKLMAHMASLLDDVAQGIFEDICGHL